MAESTGITSTAVADRRPRAIRYAEDVLGVNSTHELAQHQIVQYEDALNEQADLESMIARLLRDQSSREAKLLDEARSNLITVSSSGNVSEAAVEREFKQMRAVDEPHQAIMESLLELRNRLRNKSVEVDVAKEAIRLSIARINQLGGYLHFLAEQKAASTSAKMLADTVY